MFEKTFIPHMAATGPSSGHNNDAITRHNGDSSLAEYALRDYHEVRIVREIQVVTTTDKLTATFVRSATAHILCSPKTWACPLAVFRARTHARKGKRCWKRVRIRCLKSTRPTFYRGSPRVFAYACDKVESRCFDTTLTCRKSSDCVLN